MSARTLSLSVTLVTVLLVGRADALIKTWIGSDGGSLSTPGNWNPSGMPSAADSIVFADGAVASTYDINFDVNGLRHEHRGSGVVARAAQQDLRGAGRRQRQQRHANRDGRHI